MKFISICSMLILNIQLLHAQLPFLDNSPQQTVELGKVAWERDFQKGLVQAARVDKAVFLLFQEVPGCLTCRNYGQNVLSHPLIVEAIETLFVPVAVFNNKGGADASVLRYYGEPSWNNPVVRIVGSNKKDLVSRVGNNYSKHAVVEAMIQALDVKKQAVPKYLDLLRQEFSAELKGTETATLAMYCFWTGEKKLGKLEGVVETQPGFMGGREVVQVEYDPCVTDYETILSQAKKSSCASHVYANNTEQQQLSEKIVGAQSTTKNSKFRLDKEPKYYLSKTAYQYVPMTQLQAVKVNSRIGEGQSPNEYLSERQLALLDYIRKHPNEKKWMPAINVHIEEAWKQL